MNTDAEIYGGSGTGNLGKVETDEQPQHGHPHSISISIPPLGAVFFTNTTK